MTALGGRWRPAHLPQPCFPGTVSPPTVDPLVWGGPPGWGSKPQLEPRALHPVPELWEAGLGPAGGVDPIPV